MQKRIVTAALFALLLVGCGRDAAPPDEQAVAVAAVEMARRDLFADPPTADAQLIFVGQDSTILPRDRNAVFVPFSVFSVERDGIPNEFPPADSMARMLASAGVSGERLIIVGAPIPAGRAWAAFDYLGLGERAALLNGGPAALDTASGEQAQTATPARLSIDVRDDMIVDAEWVHARLDDPRVAILDARPPAEFSGETPGDGIDRPGHIPGARNVFWQSLVQSPEDTSLRDESELRSIFEQAGVAPGDTIVAYCRTGGQASFLYTVARHLGYEVKLYDGSYIDWSRTEYAIER
jgi:thiosulfate/3-mercaptopyruvate sulfurtransferase